jgi:hypothetical protein
MLRLQVVAPKGQLQIGPGQRPGNTPYQPDARVLMLRLQVFGPKGQSQISPGQRPGTTSTTNIRALKGRNRIRFFTGDQTRQEPRIVAPFTGMRFLRIPVRRTLPWAGMSFPLRGGISNSATSKRASEGIGGVYSGVEGLIPTRRDSEGITAAEGPFPCSRVGTVFVPLRGVRNVNPRSD